MHNDASSPSSLMIIPDVVVLAHHADQAFVDSEIISQLNERQLTCQQVRDTDIWIRGLAKSPLLGDGTNAKWIIFVISQAAIRSGLARELQNRLAPESRLRFVPVSVDSDAKAYISGEQFLTSVDFSGDMEIGRTQYRQLITEGSFATRRWISLLENRSHDSESFKHIAKILANHFSTNHCLIVSRTTPLQRTDSVNFSAFCPQAVMPGRAFVLEVFAYLSSERNEVLGMRMRPSFEVSRKANVIIERDTDIVVQVHSKTLTIRDNTDVLHWMGKIVNSQFHVEVPEDATEGDHMGTIYILMNGIQKARFLFKIEVARSHSGKRRGSWTFADGRFGETVKSIFASFASEDRADVIQWARGAETAGADVFVDVVSLRAGDNWQTQLTNEIRQRQLFCLFWSEAASKSRWVEKEWQQAMEEKGCDFIQPVPLVDPATVPPPPRLGECVHFNDMMRFVWEDAKRRKKPRE